MPRGLEEINRVYTVFKVISPEAKRESVRVNALARSELALGHKEEAAEIAKRAVELDPTAEGPRLLYQGASERRGVLFRLAGR